MIADDCVTEIVERLSDTEVEPVKPKFKGGFPVPVKRYQSKVVAPKVKPVPVASGEFEYEKLQWINEKVEPIDDGQVRFDFQGNIITSDNGVDDYQNGLYHNANQAKGYTLEDLKKLASSLHNGQRAFALGIVGHIIHKVTIHEYSFELEDLIILARMGLDSKHETVMFNSLVCLANAVGFNCYRTISRVRLIQTTAIDWQLNLTTFGSRKLNFETSSMEAFAQKRLNKEEDPELDTTVDEIKRVLGKDIIMGLLLTNITTRLRFLLTTNSSDIVFFRMTVFILSQIVKHSNSSAEDVLATNGLIDGLVKEILAITFPTTNLEYLERIGLVVDLLRSVCESSRECCQALVKYQIVRDILKFVLITPTWIREKPEILDWVNYISTGVFHTLKVCFQYGTSGSIIDSYRSIFINHQELYLKLQNRRHSDLESLTAFIQMLTAALQTYQKELDAGGSNDAFMPFLESSLVLLNSPAVITCDFLIGAIYYFMYTYIKTACTNQIIVADECKKLISAIGSSVNRAEIPDLNHLVSECKNSFQAIHTSNVLDPIGYEYCDAASLSYINNCLKLTFSCGRAANWIQLINELFVQNYYSPDEFKAVMKLKDLENSIISLNDNIHLYQELKDPKRFYLQGVYYFFERWVFAKDDLAKHRFNFSEDEMDLVRQISFGLLLNSLPGDDYLFPKLMHDILIGNRWNQRSGQLSSKHLEHLYDSKNIEFSLAVRRIDYSLSPPLFHIPVEKTELSMMPLGPDFLYSLPERMFNVSPTNDSRDAMLGWIEIVLALEDAVKVYTVDQFTKLKSIMYVLLLSDNGEDLFLFPEIQDRLTVLFTRIVSDINRFRQSSVDFEKFATFYEQLLEHYDSNSFGNAIFSKIILLPTSNMFPPSFKKTFWEKLSHQVRVFRLRLDDLWWDIDEFKGQFDHSMKLMFRPLLSRGLITPDHNELLWSIIHDQE